MADKTMVVNVKTVKASDPEVIYIGRTFGQFVGSGWGNPFKITNQVSREQVVEQFRNWIVKQPQLMARLPELKGKKLACFCHPQQCHGDVLAELANKLP